MAHYCHGKSKLLTARANQSRQKQITHGKSKSLMAKAESLTAKQFYPAEYTCLVWFVYFLWQFYSLLKNFWFRPLLTFSITSTEKACKHNIYPQFRNEMIDSILFSGGQSVLLWSSQKGIGYTTLHSFSFSSLDQCFPWTLASRVNANISFLLSRKKLN